MSSAELSWVLARAFGPVATPLPGFKNLCSSEALLLSDKLDVTSRIGHRIDNETLRTELGNRNATQHKNRYLATAGFVIRAEWICEQIARVASSLDIPLIVLKGMALHYSGLIKLGSRPMCDIDVLVPIGKEETLQRSLSDSGFSESNLPSAEHQLPVLTHSSGVSVEVHRMIRGVRLSSGGSSATADEVLQAKLCVGSAALPEGCFIPTKDLLLAHLLVHGIAQHGLAVSYPLTRIIADAQDLGFDESQLDEFMQGPFRWIQRDVLPDEVASVAELASRLKNEVRVEELLETNSRAATMLRHIVAGMTDQAYQQSMRISALVHFLPGRNKAHTLIKIVFKTLWLSRPQVDVLYGRPRTWLGYLGWRIWRPLHLIGKTVGFGWKWLVFKVKMRIEKT